ncbi:MAG: protein kinase domain-containing protein [Fimbriiglobus sp.]
MQNNDDHFLDLFDKYRDILARGGEVTPANLGVDADTFTKLREMHSREEAVIRLLAPRGMPETARYKTTTLLASGGHGDVFLADDRELRRTVALKVPKADNSNPKFKARLKAEALIMGQLDHPGIPAVYSLGTDSKDRLFYTMQFINGHTLTEKIESLHHALPVRLHVREFSDRLRPLLRRFVSVCAAIAYANSRGVIHRDLKPENVMLGGFDETLVMDWGIARAVNNPTAAEKAIDPKQVAGGHTLPWEGTIGFVSPEQWEADPTIDHRADVYSLGGILYQLLANRASLLPTEIGEGFGPENVRPLSEIKAGLPPALVAICEKAMSADRAERYVSAAELSADVQAWLDDRRVAAYSEPWIDSVARWTRRHRTAVSIAATALPLLIAMGVGSWLANRIVENAETQRAAAVSQADIYRDVASQNTTAFISAAQALRNNRTISVTAAEQVFVAAVSATDLLIEKSGRRPEVLADKARLLAEFSNLFTTDAGATARGQQIAEEAVGLIDEALKTDAERPDWLAVRAQAYSARAIARSNAGDVGDADRDRREALATATKLTKAHPEDTRGWVELALATEGIGYDFSSAGDQFTAEAWFREALELWRKVGGNPTDQENARRTVNTERLLGVCLMDCGDQAEADALLKSADERMRPFDTGVLTTKRFERNRLYVWFAQINRLVNLVQTKPSVQGELLALVGKAERLIDTLLAADPLNAEWKLGKARCRFLYANVTPAVKPAEKKALLDFLVESVPLVTKAAVDDPTNLSRRLDVLGVRQFVLWGRMSVGGYDKKVAAEEANVLADDADEIFRRYPWNVVALNAVQRSHELVGMLTPENAIANRKATQTALSVWAEARLKTDPQDPAAHRQLAESIEGRTFSLPLPNAVEQVANCRLAITHWDAVVAARPNSPRWALARAEAIDQWRICASRSFQAKPNAERYAEEVAALRQYNQAADDLVKAFPQLPAAYRHLRHARQQLATAVRAESKPFDRLRKEFPDSEVVFAEAMTAWEKQAELLPPAEAARSPFVGRGELWVGTFQTEPLLKKLKDVNREMIAYCLAHYRLNQLASGNQMLFESVVKLVVMLPDNDSEAITALADAVAVADDLRRLKRLHPFQERLNGFILVELGRRCGPSSAVAGPAALAAQLDSAARRLKAR